MADLIIGLDGGWSKTAGVLCDRDGRVLAQVQARGCAVSGIPSREARRLIRNLVDKLGRDAGISRRDVIHIGVGLSGVDHADEAPGQHAALYKALSLAPTQLTLVNDGIAAL